MAVAAAERLFCRLLFTPYCFFHIVAVKSGARRTSVPIDRKTTRGVDYEASTARTVRATGAINSAGEYNLHTVGVTGSIPVSPI